MDKDTFIIAGGGTGGHLYPALAIGQKLAECTGTNIHYVGSRFGIEADKIPMMNLNHTLLPIRGLQRGFSCTALGRNMLLPGRLLKSQLQMKKLFSKLHTKAVIGTGGYGAALPLYTARQQKIPYFIQEQNSIPGITTNHFAADAEIVFTAYNAVQSHLKKKTVSWSAIQSGKT